MTNIKPQKIRLLCYLLSILLTILFYHDFFFFLIINLYFLITAAIAQIFNPIAEFVILIEIPRKEAKIEIEIDPVIVEAEIESI